MLVKIVLLVLFLTAATVSAEVIWHQNKTRLYEKYPQLLDPKIKEQHPCIMAMSELFINAYDHNRQEMWWSSLKYATDMGDKERCQSVVDDKGKRMAIYNSNKSNVT